MKFLEIEISSNFFLERTALEMFRWGCSDPARFRYTPMTKNGTSRPEKPRNSVLPEDGVKKRYKALLTNQRRGRGSNVRVYSCVPLCGAEPWRYTVFWRLPLKKVVRDERISPVFRCSTLHKILTEFGRKYPHPKSG